MKYMNLVRKYAAPAAVVVSAAVASTAAFAVDITAEYNAAKATAMSNMDLVTIGAVGLALVTFGLGAVLAWSRK